MPLHGLQFDHKVRTVSLENLEALCRAASGMCHTFEVVKVTSNRVHVQYSNPNEYGSPQPMTAVFPCYPYSSFRPETTAVVLDILRVVGDKWDGEGWQAFDPIVNGPKLWHNPTTGEWDEDRPIDRVPAPLPCPGDGPDGPVEQPADTNGPDAS